MTAVLDPDAAVQAVRRRARTALLVVVTALVALVGGLLLGRGLGTEGPVDVDDPVSVGFAQDMKVHHAQAVEMSGLVHRRTPDPVLRALAFDVMTTQQAQIGVMTAWLDLWQEPQSSTGPVMAWMDHSGPMPGMASRADVAALETLPVPQMEVHFLRLMTAHHRGALGMAEHAAQHAESQQVADLARSVLEGQSAEIDLMADLLAARGAAPAGGRHDH